MIKADVVFKDEEHGWMWMTYIGTAVFNSRAVATGYVVDNT